jgi:hypothetical protein
MHKILATISTRNRYDKTLPMAMMSIAMQTRKPEKFILFDDSDNPKDLRQISVYQQIFRLFDEKGIEWEVLFGEKKGQVFNHQRANKMGFDLVFRLDDDEVASENVLERLEDSMTDEVGAVGGLILAPNNAMGEPPTGTDNSIEKFRSHPNLQWFRIKGKREVDHLYSSFLYRAGIVDYNLGLSKIGHSEETQFTYSLKLAGYGVVVEPKAVTYHLREEIGGIRDGAKEMWEEDGRSFDKWLEFKKSGTKLILADSGLGDHIVLKKVLPDIKEKYGKVLISCCYPEVFEGEEIISIAEGEKLENKENHNLYKWMEENNWEGDLEGAYREIYL